MAVGNFSDSTGNQSALAEQWNGSDWTVRAAPYAPGASETLLNGVSCLRATRCTAVGDYNDSGGHVFTLAERWDGTAWTSEATPSHSGDGSVLGAVSCPSRSDCVAVGHWFVITPVASTGEIETDYMLVERWNGHRWAIQPTSTIQNASLSSVSCPAVNSCVAVGAVNGKTLAEHWNGHRWATLRTPPHPRHGSGGALNAVSCPSRTACTAVGLYSDSSGGQHALAEHWNGTTWAVQSTPGGSASTDLTGVSCISGAMCIAVGTRGPIETMNLAAVWNGRRWSAQRIRTPSGFSSALAGVACGGTTERGCVAVGVHQDSRAVPHVLAERYS
jgi:hypothetical protein